MAAATETASLKRNADSIGVAPDDPTLPIGFRAIKHQVDFVRYSEGIFHKEAGTNFGEIADNASDGRAAASKDDPRTLVSSLPVRLALVFHSAEKLAPGTIA